MARMPSPAAPVCSIAAVTRSAISVVVELRGQVVGDHLGLGALLGGHLGAAGVVRTRSAASRRFLASVDSTADDVVVAELAGLLAGDLGVGDRGQHHPQGRGAQLVAGLDGGGEVGAESVLESAHARHCGSLARMPLRPASVTPHARRSRRSPARGLAAYAAWEARQFTLRRVDRAAAARRARAAAGAAPQRHPHDPRPARASRSGSAALADLEPDLVVDTGDNLAHLRRRARRARRARRRCSTCPGVFVLGSNDYFAPALRNPLRYLLPDDGQRNTSTPAAAVAATSRTRFGDGRLARPDQPPRVADGAAAPRSPSPASTTRTWSTTTWTRVAGPADADGRPAAGGGARAVPPRARPVRRRRLRRDHRRATPTAARCACRAVGRSPPTATSSPPAPAACTATPPTPAPATRLGLAARVGRARHQRPTLRFRVACRPEATLMTFVPAS